MKKIKTTYEQAAIEYKEFYGTEPTISQLMNLYHAYATNWKQYNGFTDWLINTQD